MDEYGSRSTVRPDVIDIAELHHWTSSDDGLSLDGSSCSTVVTDSVDSDSTPSPFLLRGLQFLKRTEMHDVGSGRQCESGDTYCTESDDSQSTTCSESIFDPTKRLTGLGIKETKTGHTSNQRFTNDAGSKSPVISVLYHPSSDHQHQSPSLKMHQRDGRDRQVNEESSLMTIDDRQETTRVHPASCNHGALSLSLGQDSSHSRSHISRHIDDYGKNSGAGGDCTDDIPSHPCSSVITTGPVEGPDTIIVCKHQECERSADSFDHQSAPSPEKMRKLSDGSEPVYLSDSLEDVTQVDGSACMFSDSSPVKSQSDHVLLPHVHTCIRDAGCSEEEMDRNKQQQLVRSKSVAIKRQLSDGADDTTFDECQIINFSCIESYHSSRQSQQEGSTIIQPFTIVNASGSSMAHPQLEAGIIIADDLTCNESINSLEIERKDMRKIEGANGATVTKPKPHPDRISPVSKMETDVSQENSHSEEDPGRSVGEGLQSTTGNTNSTDVANVVGGQGKSGNTFAKKGKRQKRSLQAVNERATSSHFDRSLDQPTARSQRQNAGIHRSDKLIHERVLDLQEKLMNVKLSHNKLTQALSKPKKVIKDAAKVGQELLGIQTNLRQIAADLKEVKTDLERSLFDLRFVHSQRKRKGYVQQELNSVLEIQQTLWTQLKVHREIASRLQDIIRKHTKEMKENRKKQVKHSTEKRNDRRQSPRLTPSSVAGSAESSCDHGADTASGCTTKESLAAEKQNALLQQLLGTLGECEGNLLVKFMSVLQGGGQDPENAALDLNKASQANSSSGGLGDERGGGMVKNTNLTSSSRDRDISADDMHVRKLGERGEADVGEIMKDSPDFSAESSSRSKKNRMGSSSKLNPGQDMSEKETTADDDDCSSSGDGVAGECMSSSDDEMSVVPEPGQKLSEAPNCKVLKMKGAVGISGQVAPSGQVVPAVLQVDEDANDSVTADQSSVSINSCYSTIAVELASLTSIQKTVQASTSQFCNDGTSSAQKTASFHIPWKVLASNIQRDNSSIDVAKFQQVPSDYSIKSASPSDEPLGAYSNMHGEETVPQYVTIDKSLPTVKKHFKLVTIPKTTSSGNVQTLTGSHLQTSIPVIARLASQTERIRLGPVQRVSPKAVPLLQNTTRSISAMPKSSLQDEQHPSKLSNRVDSGTACPTLRSKDGVKNLQAGAISRGAPNTSANGSTLTCEERTRPVATNADPSFGVSGTQRDARYQPDQVPNIPDMKLFKKIHLINENELMPYTEILPKEMWTTDDISMVEMPKEFFEEIDSW